jgi:hypothetical protein
MRLTFLVAVAVKRRVRKLGRFEVDEADTEVKKVA